MSVVYFKIFFFIIVCYGITLDRIYRMDLCLRYLGLSWISITLDRCLIGILSWYVHYTFCIFCMVCSVYLYHVEMYCIVKIFICIVEIQGKHIFYKIQVLYYKDPRYFLFIYVTTLFILCNYVTFYFFICRIQGMYFI